ncbi:SulP family inorganic anion transporter [Acinetobacter sp. ANC 4648]|uniref:SulP family inorganic anion transporter n=1 Tax=Acinetobacter sp. ANC 4648 TaxID=1977875 RepID=UPI000A336C2C|nr:sulfate permease [Acinetobacter sp. ANC 4648]OTG80307.1 sodium-independent anion transporter [Acinetobacter sp. ANC 4648]
MANAKLKVLTFLPAWQWLKDYNSPTFKADLLSALIVIAMLVPQGMAYAIVAGLPPVTGLYASILPMIIYAIIGGSSTLSIGPVALISMMTFATLNPLFEVGSPVYIQAACLLALMVGIISFLLGIFKFGFLIRLISHPVIKSFIIASAVLIAFSQVKLLFDVPLKADNISSFILSMWQYFPYIHIATLIFGMGSILFLVLVPKLLNSAFISKQLPSSIRSNLIKALPLILVFASILLVHFAHLDHLGIKTVGEIPSEFPPIAMPYWSWDLIVKLFPGAMMIAMVSFVESISIAQATAFQKRKKINSNQELIALGLANLGAGISSSFPVTGSLSRTVVNADAGAKTPMAGVISSIFIIIVSLYFTGLFRELPLAILAATIMVSIWKLVDFKPFIETWHYSKADGIAMWVTFFGVLCFDISTGLIIGIISTFMLLLWRISRPHIAVIGLIQDTQHFRNVSRHNVITNPQIVSIRIDESLTFLNANTLKEFIIAEVSQNNLLKHVIINCSSISSIDLSALETLEEINEELLKLDIQLHFSEVKGPVMDKLQHSKLLQHLRGKIFLSHFQAVQELEADLSYSQTSYTI